jgi:hypothetical protein
MNAMAGITATAALKEKILLNMQGIEPRPRLSARKIAVACFAVTVCLFSTLVYAGVIDLGPIYKLVFGDGAGYIEQYVRPLETVYPQDVSTIVNNGEQTFGEYEAEADSLSDISDGIQIRLLSAYNDAKSLRIFAAATDLVGDRLSIETRFADWWLDQGHGGSIGVIDYDSTTKTAILLIASLGGEHKGQANLQINGYTDNGQFIENKAEPTINLYDLLQEPPVVMPLAEVYFTGGSNINAHNQEELAQFMETAQVLGFGAMAVSFESIAWSVITNVGFVDGSLHIQTITYPQNGNNLHLPAIRLADKTGNVLYNADLSISYRKSRNIGSFLDDELSAIDASQNPEYTDMIYKNITAPEQLRGLSVYLDYVLEPQANAGSWQFSFAVPEPATMNIAVMKELTINGHRVFVDTVSLSPTGVSLKLPSSYLTDYQPDQVAVVYQDGSVVSLADITQSGHEDEIILTFGGSIIEVEKVRELVVNGEVVAVP